MIGQPATASVTVSAQATAPALALFAVAATTPAAEGTVAVSRALIDSFDAPWTATSVAVVIGGEPVLLNELEGPVVITETLGRPVSASLTLVGARWSAHATERTWTRVPVEITLTQGPPGGVTERVYPLLVRTCREVHTDGDPVIALELGDRWALVERFQLCHEVSPLSGLRRGTIVRELCTDAGLTVDCPPGSVFLGAVQAINQRVLAWLEEFVEPEGWVPVFEGTTLRFVSADLVQPPLPADHEWTAAHLFSLTSTPPSDVPSRWVVRGRALQYADAAGVETTVTTTEVRAPYAPRAAVSVQLSDGSTVPSGVSGPDSAERVVSRVVVTVRTQGGRVLEQVTREWGWYNPAAAVLVSGTVPGGGGGPDGWYWSEAYLDEDGSYRLWPVERFVEVSSQRQLPAYGPTGSVLSTVTESTTWSRRTMGCRTDSDAPGAPTISAVAVGDDDNSYQPRGSVVGFVAIEAFELSSRHIVTNTYGESGAVLFEEQATEGYYAPRTAVDGAVGNYVRYDGSGQEGLVAGWLVVERRSKSNLVSADGLLLGTTERTSGYRVTPKHDGQFDLGGGLRSNRVAESFGLVESKSVRYTAQGSTQVEEETVSAGRREARLVVGSAPLPRFEESDWTQMVQAPLDLQVDDDTAGWWFGAAVDTLDNPYIQDLGEADAVLRRRRAAALATTYEVDRPDTQARPGETVLLRWPGLPPARARVDSIKHTRHPATGEATAQVRLAALQEDA